MSPTPHPSCWRVLLRSGAWLGELMLLVTAAHGQSRPRMPKEVQPLLSSDWDTWMQGVAELRRTPQARELLLQAIESQSGGDRRWRIFYHLAEFGTADDAATLVPLLDGMPEGVERRVLLGTVHAIYPAPSDGADLTTTVKDFAFLQTTPPAAQPSDSDNKFVLTDLTLQTYWLDRVSPQVVNLVQSLKGRRFDNQKSLAEALQSRLTPRLWADYGERMLAPLTVTPPRMAQEGMLRYKVENTLQRPLLLAVEPLAWFGRLQDPPARRFIYLKPGESVQVDQPIRVVGPKDPGKVRIDLRARELNGPRIPLNSKLYVPMQG